MNGHDAHVGVDGAKGVIGRDSLGRGQSIEDGAFPNIGQTNNSAIQRHSFSLLKGTVSLRVFQ
jgi:hypothetical protein